MATLARTASAAAVVLGLTTATASVGEAPTEFPPGEGQPQVQATCAPCHAITVVTSARKSVSEWATTVDAMITRGAPVADADYDVIVEYLARNFSAQ